MVAEGAFFLFGHESVFYFFYPSGDFEDLPPVCGPEPDFSEKAVSCVFYEGGLHGFSFFGFEEEGEGCYVETIPGPDSVCGAVSGFYYGGQEFFFEADQF